MPSGLGGVRKPKILCEFHNNKMSELCDTPLIEQLAFFVHALKVVKDRGEPGVPLTGVMPDGSKMHVDRDQVPRPPVEVLERSEDGRPVKVSGPTREAMRKFAKSMGLNPNLIDFEERSEALPPLKYALTFGDQAGLRGILKIGYEFVRGALGARAGSVENEKIVHDALLHSADSLALARWLPFEFLPPETEAEYFSHRLFAWTDGEATLVIVELFSTLPFVVRIPGVILDQPAYYIQGIHGQQPICGSFEHPPKWHWADIPEHAQPAMFEEFKKRTGAIIESMQFSSLISMAMQALIDAIVSKSAAADDAIIAAAVIAIDARLAVPMEDRVRQIVETFGRAMLPTLRQARP